MENGPRTILPYLLGGVIPPSILYLSDRVVRSLTQTIADLQRVMLSHAAGRLHGGEKAEKRFPQLTTAMPDPPGSLHHDIALRDLEGAPTARGDTLHGSGSRRFVTMARR
eukprot:6405569-Prymnesium_polylepis.1